MKKLFTVILMMLLIAASAINVSAEEKKEGRRFNIMLVLDASGSMKETDPNGLRFEAISLFVNLLTERGNNLGGIVFSDNISVKKTPIAINSREDKNTIINLLRDARVDGMTNIGDALYEAVNSLKENGDPNLPSVIVFLSDGHTELQTEEEVLKSNETKDKAVQNAKENNIGIYSVCLNVNNEAHISEISGMSQNTGGVFNEVKTAEDLQAVFNTFYNLIYGTSTTEVSDDVFPEEEVIEESCDVPEIGVEEVNIIIYGNPDNLTVYDPDGVECKTDPIVNKGFIIVKIPNPVKGKYKIKMQGKTGSRVKVDVMYNTNFEINALISNRSTNINPKDLVRVKATFKDGTSEESSDRYTGYVAFVHILDSLGNEVAFYQMRESADGFESNQMLTEGTYFLKVIVQGNNLRKESSLTGPIVVSESAPREEIISVVQEQQVLSKNKPDNIDILKIVLISGLAAAVVAIVSVSVIYTMKKAKKI